MLRAFPARHDEVICIHSTDTYGNRSNFSPTAQAGDNFATIGEAVTSARPVHLCYSDTDSECTMSKCGTSFATPIVAGIAAFLLLYTRLHLGEEEVSMLKRSSAMKAILRTIATTPLIYFMVLKLIRNRHQVICHARVSMLFLLMLRSGHRQKCLGTSIYGIYTFIMLHTARFILSSTNFPIASCEM